MEKLGWLPNGVFLELLALCQCLPGPSSTQLSFALGVTQQGTVGGLLSGGAPFLLPCRASAYFPGVPARLRTRERMRFLRRGRSPSSPNIVRQRRRTQCPFLDTAMLVSLTWRHCDGRVDPENLACRVWRLIIYPLTKCGTACRRSVPVPRSPHQRAGGRWRLPLPAQPARLAARGHQRRCTSLCCPLTG